MHFNRLVECYPNKKNNASAYKAFKVAILSEPEKKQKQVALRIIDAAKVYAFNTAGDDSDYLFLLSNFIREDHWKDVIESHPDFDAYLVYIDDLKKESLSLISEWNKACKSHWAKVHEPEKKIDIGIQALKCKEFRKHWKDALKKAKLIFYRPFRDSEKNAWITISFPWFCKVKNESHTVLKIIDGEYGHASNSKANYPQYKEITQSDRKKAHELFTQIFTKEYKEKLLHGKSFSSQELEKEDASEEFD